MNVASIKNHTYILTNTSVSTLLNGDSGVLVALNLKYGHRILDILRIAVDQNANIHEVTTTLVSTVGLVAGNIGFNGEYPFPSDLLKPKRVEISYDGETFRRASFYDNGANLDSEYNEDQLLSTFSELSPVVDFTRDSFKIRPPKSSAGDITGGIYIEYEQRQADLTTGSPTFESNLHDILAFDLAELEALMHKSKYDAEWWNRFTTMKVAAEYRFMEFYKNRFKRNSKIEPNHGGSNLSYN